MDALEAAVVLEAWGGLSSEKALELGERMLADAAPETPSTGAVPVESLPPSPMRFIDYAGLVMIVAVVAVWSEALATTLEGPDVAIAWKVALPMALSLQWLLRRRYLANERLGALRMGAGFAACVVAGIAIALPALLGVAGALAAMLVVVWVGAMIVAQRGWALQFGTVLALTAWFLGGDVAPLLAFGILALATLVVCVLAVASSPEEVGAPVPWRRAIPAGLAGAGFGLILVSDPGVRWGIGGALPVLAYLPALVGGLWASFHLRSIWEALPEAARQTAIGEEERRPIVGPPAAVLAGAAARLGVIAAPLSALVVLVVDRDGGNVADAAGILVGFAAVALASLVVGLIDSCNLPTWTLASVASGLAIALAVRALPPDPIPPGGTLFIGGIVIVVVAAAPVMQMIRTPGRRLATSVFIP
jgi:hypothetical protein